MNVFTDDQFEGSCEEVDRLLPDGVKYLTRLLELFPYTYRYVRSMFAEGAYNGVDRLPLEVVPRGNDAEGLVPCERINTDDDMEERTGDLVHLEDVHLEGIPLYQEDVPEAELVQGPVDDDDLPLAIAVPIFQRDEIPWAVVVRDETLNN